MTRKAKVTPQEASRRVAEKHNGTIALDESTYTDTKKKARFIDELLGEFWAIPNNVFNGTGHPDGRMKKAKETCIKKYGVPNVSMVGEFARKREETMLSRYGERNPSLVPEFKEKRINKFIENYGEISPLKNDAIKEKVRNTCIKRYGVSCALKSEHVRKKGRKTSLERYGVPHPSMCDSVKQKAKETSVKKYGAEHHLQVRENAIEHARRQTSSSTCLHWLTGEELVCQGGWEPKVVDYFNSNEIDFLWQPQVFPVPNGRTYRPDCYRYNGDGTGTWIEIKGYMRDDAKEKWDWFLTEHPTAELWDKAKLESLGIL